MTTTATPPAAPYSDDCVFPGNVRAVAARLAGPVDLQWTTGDQIDFYDQPVQTACAVDAADAHFQGARR